MTKTKRYKTFRNSFLGVSKIPFKDFHQPEGLLEATKWSSSLSDKLFDIGVGLHGLWLPMSPSIFRRIGLNENRATVFHVTDKSGFLNIKKMQGTKKSISAFFEMQNRYFTKGIQTMGGVIVELDANVLSAWREDVMSSPDKSGRRWIQLSYFQGMYRVSDEIKQISDDMEKLIRDLVDKHVPPERKKQFDRMSDHIAWMNLDKMIRTLPDYRQRIGSLIKDYIDGVEVVMSRNVDKLRSIFQSYLKRRYTDSSWDEIIVNNFKIKKVHVVDSDAWHRSSQSGDPDEDDYKGYLDFIEDVKAGGIEAKFWESEMELELYIRKIAKEESERE